MSVYSVCLHFHDIYLHININDADFVLQLLYKFCKSYYSKRPLVSLRGLEFILKG